MKKYRVYYETKNLKGNLYNDYDLNEATKIYNWAVNSNCYCVVKLLKLNINNFKWELMEV